MRTLKSTTLSMSTNKIFELSNDKQKVLCKINNIKCFEISRQYTSNNCKFIDNWLTLSCSETDEDESNQYDISNYVVIIKKDENLYRFFAGNCTSEFTFDMTLDEFMQFKTFIMSEEDMLDLL